MAKYIVSRTSDWRGEEKPVEGATPVMVHWYCMVSGIAANSYRKDMMESQSSELEKARLRVRDVCGENIALTAENNRLRNRSFIDRILNK